MPYSIYHLVLVCLFSFLSSISFGQVTSIYKDADQYFQEGMMLYVQSNLGLARNSFAKVTKKLQYQFDERADLLKTQATYMVAKTSLEGGYPDGEKLIVQFFQQNRPDPLAYQALKDVANIKYEKRLYQEALNYFEQIEAFNLSLEDQNEVYFKKGYCYFVKKDFERAERSFNMLLGKDSDYFYPTFYYMGMTNFFQEDYTSAVKNFMQVEQYELYKDRIPYYIAQIYFAQKEYSKILTYIPRQLDNPRLKNKKEIRHILGQTYFLQNQYEKALPHLEYYESNSPKMRKEDFYQLAFTLYQLGFYEKAAVHFKEISKIEEALGQISNNYLADCYLKLENKEDARISFKNVTNYNLDSELESEAQFNFGKLSAELGYDRAAIKALMELEPSFRSYSDAQIVLGELFESSRDYSMVINTIEGMSNPAPRIREAYQKVCLERGIQLIKDGQKSDAKITLIKGSQAPISNYYSALIFYYLADLLHQEGDYIQSTSYMNKYFTLASLVDKLPQNAGILQANYLQAYNFLKQKEYNVALDYFSLSFEMMQDEAYGENNDLTKRRIFADVLNRMADCHFTANRYEQARKYYASASSLNFPGRDYAYFQQSMVNGLQGKYFEKIVLLEEMISKIPSSSIIDDAYFQIGETHFTLGNFREAELAYVKILPLKGRTNLVTRALLKLGLIAYNKGDVTKATEYYTGIFDNNPNKNEAQEALIALEEIYIQDLGKADEFMAIVESKTGYKLSSLERDSLSYLAAQGRFENGEYIEAIDSYTRYIDQFPNGINKIKALYNRAESNSILKKYAKALPDYEAIVKLGPSEFYEESIHKTALIAYNDLQQFKKAFNYYSLLEEVTDDLLLKYEAQVGALRSAYRDGDLDAILYMANKVNTSPLANKEDKALANFYAGKMNYVLKSWDPAIANLTKVVELVDNINAAESKFLINEILFLKGDHEVSEESTLETISNSTAYPYWVAKNLILLSDIFMEKKDVFNAKAALEAVIENFPETDEVASEARDRLVFVLEEEDKLNRIEETDSTLKLDTLGNE